MSAYDDLALPDSNLTDSTNQTKFNDVWWFRSKTGLAALLRAIVDAILGFQVAQLDASWNPTTTMTWLGREVAALPQNFANTKAAADAATTAVAQLRADLPALVDKAVGDALAAKTVTATTDNAAIADAVVTALGAKLKA